MYLKNKTVARTVHKVLVLLERRDGEETSSLWRMSSWPTGEKCFHIFWIRKVLGKGQRRMLVEKGLTLSFFLRAELDRLEILYTLRKEEHRLPLSRGGECPSQETYKRIISSTTRFEKRP